MTEHLPARPVSPPRRMIEYLIEQQLVRLDGTVLVSFLATPTVGIRWEPAPGQAIVGACAGRVRELPDGGWRVLAYFPDGWPGRAELWPQGQVLP